MARFSPWAVVGEIAVGEHAWTEGFWAERFRCCKESMIPAMWKILSDDSLSHAFANFRIAAGLEPGNHAGPPFFDGDLYKWLEAVASVYAVARDPDLDALMDRVVAVIAAAQRSDGYLHTPVLIAERNKAIEAEQAVPISAAPGRSSDDAASSGSPPAAMADRLHFEVYNFGHLMTTACRHHQATGKDSLLAVAIRAADYLIARFARSDSQTAKNNICPSHYMGLVELYRVTGFPRFRDFAASLIDNRNLIQDGTDDNQDRIPFRDQRRAVGHAVRANYLYAGITDIYMETGDRSLLPALMAIRENVATTKTYITGATGALYDGVSPDGDEDHWSIQRVHQAYGREYQLPATTAYNESCANIGNALWNWRMFRMTGDARYMDTVETALLNSVLSGISIDGTKYFYQNTLREERHMPVPLRWPRHRAPYLSSFCCPPNVVRTIAGAGNWAYGIARDLPSFDMAEAQSRSHGSEVGRPQDDSGGPALLVTLYGAGRLATQLPDGSPLVLTQKTGYPWEEDILLQIEDAPRTAFSVCLRIPAWAAGARCTAYRACKGGLPEDIACQPGSFARIRGSWAPGDRVELHLPLRPRIMLAHPLVEESRNQGAVMRGPIVYCLESADLPEGMGISEAYLPSDARFSVEAGEGELRGMNLLACEGWRLPPEADSGLYRELPRCGFDPVRLKFVPYFAWDNRMQGEMSVWLLLRWK